MRSKVIGLGMLTFILWAATAAVGFWEAIFVVRSMLLRIFAVFWGDYWSGVTLNNFAVLVLSVIWVAFAIGSAEYHRTRVGQRASWKLFGLTAAVELAILAMAFFV